MKTLSQLKQDSNSKIILHLFALSCLCCLMAFARVSITHRYGYLNLLWNLFLAWIPLVLAFFLHQNYYGKNRNTFFLFTTFFLWILFFPNAPYLITDLVHLNHKSSQVPLWFDSVLLFSFAVAGLVLGYMSLYLIHSIVKNRWNRFTTWFIIGFILSLSSFGIYLGRVLRANSWDLFTGPGKLIEDSITSLSDPTAIKMTILFSFFLLFSYLILYSIIKMNQKNYDH